MASASTTPNLNLPQWVETEKPERTDFNAAFDAIDDHVAESASKHITESGSDTYGRYVKFDDGTLIMHLRRTFVNVPLSDSYGNLYFHNQTYACPLPAAYVGNLDVAVSLSGSTRYCWPVVTSVTSNVNVRFFTSLSGTTDVSVYIVAIGRWK